MEIQYHRPWPGAWLGQSEINTQTPEVRMSPWKNRLVVLTLALLSVSLPIFVLTGYTALYWA